MRNPFRNFPLMLRKTHTKEMAKQAAANYTARLLQEREFAKAGETIRELIPRLADLAIRRKPDGRTIYITVGLTAELSFLWDAENDRSMRDVFAREFANRLSYELKNVNLAKIRTYHDIWKHQPTPTMTGTGDFGWKP